MKNSVYLKNDWDHDVIDVFLYFDAEEIHIKGFDDTDWRQATDFANKLSKSIGWAFLGDLTDT